ncbi:MAG: porin [Pseudomonas sp.]
MKKNLIAIVVGAAAAMPALAMAADVSVYGRVHVSVDYLDDGADYSETNISSNSSRLGFKGSRDLESMKAFFQIEQEVNISNNGTSDTLTTRDTFVGLSGDFGMFRLGRFDTPFKTARGPANIFGDMVGDMRNLTRVGNARFDERTPNTIHYQTPKFGGLAGNIAYSLHEGTTNDDGTNNKDKDDAISLSLTYAEGPFDAAIAYESYSEDAERGDRKAWRTALGYKVTDAVKVVGFYQNVDYKAGVQAVQDANTSDTWGLGADFKVAPKTYLRGMWMTRDADLDDSKSNMLAVGVEHRLDSALRVYANYAVVSNDDNVALNPWSQGRTAARAGAAGENAKGFSTGLRYDF